MADAIASASSALAAVVVKIVGQVCGLCGADSWQDPIDANQKCAGMPGKRKHKSRRDLLLLHEQSASMQNVCGH